jgi:uncharacterized membrane protein YhaH (DUF805 family)
MEWYQKVLRQYADFTGRARRKEYWMFTLFNALIMLVPYAILLVGALNQSEPLTYLGGGLLVVYALAVLVPSIAVGIRRLHDTNRSGWWMLLNLTGIIPVIGIIGPIVLFVFFVLDGNPGPTSTARTRRPPSAVPDSPRHCPVRATRRHPVTRPHPDTRRRARATHSRATPSRAASRPPTADGRAAQAVACIAPLRPRRTPAGR